SALVAGSGAVWLVAGVVLLAAAIATAAAANAMGVPMLLAVGAIAVGWQVTPLRQICLNRCHWLPRLSAFGFAADRDCVSFGLAHGFWCPPTCAPLMLLPIIAQQIHLPLMALLSVSLRLEIVQKKRATAAHGNSTLSCCVTKLNLSSSNVIRKLTEEPNPCFRT